MKRWQAQCLKMAAVAALLCCAVLSATAADETYHATITFCGGQKTVVRNFQIVYAWREMPADAVGLTPYKLQSKAERGLWIRNSQETKPAFKLIPFSELDSIEFDSGVQQLGVSMMYEFRVTQVRLNRVDKRPLTFSAELLAANAPVLWPQAMGARFPEDAGDQQIDQVSVSLRGQTKAEGQDSEFVFMFSRPVREAIESVARKNRQAFPQSITLTRESAVTKTAATER